MTFEQVDAIGQGRVWSGTNAVEIGLADQIGGMDDAIKYAASLVKIKKYATVDYPEYEKNIMDYLENLGLPFLQSKETMIREEVGEANYKVWQQVKKLQAREGIQTMMPYEINIH